MPTPLIRWLVAIAFAAAAVQASAAEVQFPPGSRIGLVPPPGMKLSTTPPGFQDPDRRAVVLLLELPLGAYLQLESSMATAKAQQHGITVERRETLFTDAGAALLSVGEDTGEKVRKWMMVALMPDFTAVVSVQIPPAARDRYSDEAVRAALASLALRPAPIAEQLALLPYKIGDLAGFRVVSVVNRNAVILTDGPSNEARPADQPHLLVSIVPLDPAQPADRDRIAQLAFNSIPGFVDRKVTVSEMLRVDGQPVHEIRADAREVVSKTPVTMVQWLRFGQNAFVHILGVTTKDNWSRDFPKFRAVRDSIEPKG
jgi:hypothetical protein